MGVPKFAPWLTKKYPAIVSNTCPEGTHGLYIDLNGLIHPCCHSENDPSVARLPEAEKLQCICHEIEQLVATVRPSSVLYIATDGVAPRAKMNQQRARRYMSVARRNNSAAIVEEVAKEVSPQDVALADADLDNVREELMKDALYGNILGEGENSIDVLENEEDVGIPSNDILGHWETHNGNQLCGGDISRKEDLFDSNCITPGTVFMSKVARAVQDMVEEKLVCDDPLWERLHVIVSTSQTPGEGEHKIVNFIRTQSSYSGFNGRGAHVIVGLDADLIFLALTLHIPHVIVMRDQSRNSYKPKYTRSYKNSKKIKTKNEKFRNEKARKKHEEKDSSEDDADDADDVLVDDDHDDAKEEKDVDEVNDNASGNDLENVIDSNGDTNYSQHFSVKKAYIYYNIDVVGTSIASEIHGLCQIKGFTPKEVAAFAPEYLISPGGYHFYRQAGLPDGKKCGGAFFDEHGNTKDNVNPCLSLANSKLIDDFVVLGMLMGNDFLPRLPSAFCGESAMDNLIELYITDVLPYGFLTSGDHDIDLTQLRRLFSSYAKIETVKFRQFAIFSNRITAAEAAATLHAPVDECWRQPYLQSTGLAAHVDEACRKYIQGLRFVWRYYSDSLACSWSWFYPFHHAPFALDLADYLLRATAEMLEPPPLEVTPPNTFVQLLCVLPPTSYSLLPAALGEVMLRPPPELRETFPTTWQLDCAGAYGKEYLAAVMLPFANVEGLRELVEKVWPCLSKEEQQIAEQVDYHIVMRRAVEHVDNRDDGADTFHLNGDVRELCAGDVTWTLRSGITYKMLHDSLPQRSRPKVYPTNASIPRVTCDSNSWGHARERRHQRERYGRRVRRGWKASGETESTHEVGSSDRGTCIIQGGVSFAEVLIGSAAVSVLTVFAVAPSSALQLAALNLAAIALAFVLGIAVKNPLSGSGIHRNNINATYVDWLCPDCLSLNFSRNNRCFSCQLPFDNRRCLAIFGGAQPPTPPLMDPNHTPYIETVALDLSFNQ